MELWHGFVREANDLLPERVVNYIIKIKSREC
jgi:hypothetical protein